MFVEVIYSLTYLVAPKLARKEMEHIVIAMMACSHSDVQNDSNQILLYKLPLFKLVLFKLVQFMSEFSLFF